MSTLFGFSQEEKSLLDFISLNEKQSKNDLLVEMKWDFSEFNKSNDHFFIEIIPIQDCWNRLEAEMLNEGFEIVIDNKNKLLEDNLIISHLKLKAKCFKYRVGSKKTHEKKSDWSFYTFVNL
ncbi:hypothetical protein KK2020170_16040 [Flavobacterium okayamense]|uniref:Uncharacterized protein n=2 Tax=Flavobacterium okayamense TaxID=2830782 RepID=A0ABM7S5G9_9FLAO|nr:hypothetical protein KK2020170_16040 [Flavobacterium okayamense]